MIDWLNLLIVSVVSIGAATLILALVGTGIRLLAMSAPSPGDEGPAAARDDEEDDIAGTGRPRWATIVAYACFAGFALVVLTGIWLIVPYFGG